MGTLESVVKHGEEVFICSWGCLTSSLSDGDDDEPFIYLFLGGGRNTVIFGPSDFIRRLAHAGECEETFSLKIRQIFQYNYRPRQLARLKAHANVKHFTYGTGKAFAVDEFGARYQKLQMFFMASLAW